MTYAGRDLLRDNRPARHSCAETSLLPTSSLSALLVVSRPRDPVLCAITHQGDHPVVDGAIMDKRTAEIQQKSTRRKQVGVLDDAHRASTQHQSVLLLRYALIRAPLRLLR